MLLAKNQRQAAIFKLNRPLCLASASPRRIAFFESLGIPVSSVSPPDEAEPSPASDEYPEAYAIRAALAKAKSVSAIIEKDSFLPVFPSFPLVIAADTIVVLAGRILGKPTDADDAFAMLSALSGQRHSVITGCALLVPEESDPRVFAVKSAVSMWDCPRQLLRAYANGGEPLDKAGAYAVQGAGAFLIKSIEGSWSNVVGLPLAEIIQELCSLGVLSPVGTI